MEIVEWSAALLRRAVERLGPYLLIEILLPGGSLLALLLFLYRRYRLRVVRRFGVVDARGGACVVAPTCLRPHVDIGAHGPRGDHLRLRRIRVGWTQPFEHVIAKDRRESVTRLEQPAVFLQEREHGGCRMH